MKISVPKQWQMKKLKQKLTNVRDYSRTSITLTLNFLSIDQNSTEIYPDNSNSPLTRTALRLPSESVLESSIYRSSSTV